MTENPIRDCAPDGKFGRPLSADECHMAAEQAEKYPIGRGRAYLCTELRTDVEAIIRMIRDKAPELAEYG